MLIRGERGENCSLRIASSWYCDFCGETKREVIGDKDK
jgi:hypothetical protein